MNKRSKYRQFAAIILGMLYLVVLSPSQLLHSHHNTGESPSPVSQEFSQVTMIGQQPADDFTDCSICNHQYSTYDLESRSYPLIVEATCCIHPSPTVSLNSTFLTLLSNKGPPLYELSQSLLC